MAGRFEAPIYGMLAVETRSRKMDWGASGKPEVAFHGQPLDNSKPTMLWDGEWEVTYVTFRDMGPRSGWRSSASICLSSRSSARSSCRWSC